jgi:hypothetical protein
MFFQRLLACLLLAALLPACAAVKLASVAGKAATAGTAASGAAKVGAATKLISTGKGATAVVGAATANEVLTVASVADDAWRMGRATEELGFLAKSPAGRIRSTGSKALDGALQCADFADWAEGLRPEDGCLAGQGAPRDVADAFLEATYPATPLSKSKLIQGRYWMQFYRMEAGDRLVVYDTRTKGIKIIGP